MLPYPRPQPQSLERKRLNEFPAIPQAAKRPRAPPTHLSRPSSSHRQSTASRSKVIIPDIEYVSDKELEQDDSTPTPDSAESVGKNGGDKQSESLGSSRSSTPPLQEGEEELRRRREELVQREKSLTTVFPSSLTRKTSQRRKVPIFCATGSQPHIVSIHIVSIHIVSIHIVSTHIVSTHIVSIHSHMWQCSRVGRSRYNFLFCPSRRGYRCHARPPERTFKGIEMWRWPN